MGMAKRILKHGWLIAFVLILVIGYTQREFLFPVLFEHERAEESDTEVLALRPAEPSVEPGPDERIAESRPPGEPDATGAADTSRPPAASASAPASASELQAADEQAADAEPAPRWGRPPDDFGGDDAVMRTDRARAAFWAGDYDRAIILYRELVNDFDRNPDLYGEMGNVYYAQGQWREAAQAYYEAAERLLHRGQTSRAAHLNRLIRNLDQELANRLDRELATAYNRNQ